MAGWRDSLGRVEFQDGRKLIGATFRGVAFFVEVAELSGGRRTVRHEFPLRDTPYIEDLGRRARTFPVEGYVLGDDYLAVRNALIAALEEAGPGELVHPSYGKRRVALTGDFRVRESFVSEGRLARFSMEFGETEVAPAFPSATPAAGALVSSSADAADAAISSDLTARYSVAGQPSAALASLSAIVSSAAAAMRAALAPFVRETQQLAALKRDLDNLVLDAATLVQEPAEVFTALHAAIVSLGRAPLTPSLGIQALLTAYGFTPSSARPVATTPSRVIEQANWDALVGTVRSLAVTECARLALDETFDSYAAAVALRDSIIVKLDEQAETAGDAAFAALAQLRAELVRAIPGEASDLPHLVTHTPAFTVPSLVLAHRLYGDVTLEADIVARNRTPHPGFIPGGAPLQVLSRG